MEVHWRNSMSKLPPSYTKCEIGCGIDLFDEEKYTIINGLKHLPCNQLSLEQKAACEFHCRALNLLNSQCTFIDGLPVCKCSSDNNLPTSTSPTTKTTETTATTSESVSSSWEYITLKGHSSAVSCIIVLDNGDFVCGGYDYLIILWDGVTYRKKRIMKIDSSVYSCALLPNDHLAVSSEMGETTIWEPQTGTLKMTFNSHEKFLEAIALYSDNKLATANFGGKVQLWNLVTGELINTIYTNQNIYSLAHWPNGYLASGGNSKIISLCNITSSDCIYDISTLSDFTFSLKVLNSGELASVYNNDIKELYGIQVWDQFNFTLKATYTGLHKRYVVDIAELPNGDLASASQDKTINIWDRATGKVKKTFSYHTNVVTKLALLKNGLLASGSADTTIIISKI
jgi:WD40 repeat protein